MSSTLLEVTRASHEEVERLERLVVKDLQTDPPTNKDRLHQSHRVRNMIEQITSTTHKLIEIYEDKDNARKDEIAALGGQSSTSANVNVFSAFYDRLKEIREYHRRHPAARYVVDTNDEYEQLLKEEPVIEFTGEESFPDYEACGVVVFLLLSDFYFSVERCLVFMVGLESFLLKLWVCSLLDIVGQSCGGCLGSGFVVGLLVVW
ncbi:UNVERIFIED_CONTAM: Splicing factor SF3a60 [Sesamum angustifolium]|uniref:Splicing factor SF3a60 n=1 Tax=Sesamum angustifolium TaxID=2727405 RepID=A0AAW2LG08_9LAMI